MRLETTNKARVVLGEVFDHIIHDPLHRNIRGWVPLESSSVWHFRCEECGKEWGVRRVDTLNDPILKSWWSRGDPMGAPMRVIQEILKMQGTLPAKKNAWETLQDGFLDDDS